MTYLTFHFVFILPAILAVYFLRRMEPRLDLPAQKTGIAVLCLIALVYTTPWDNYLVAAQVWDYGEGRVMTDWIIGYVPLEEYLFFVLQPILTGSFLLLFASRFKADCTRFDAPLLRGRPAWLGAATWIVLGAAGVGCLTLLNAHYQYLGLILVWACPVLAFQWAYGGGTLWALRRLLIWSVGAPTIYLWLVDLIAIEWRIWEILPATSTGWMLLGLPVEEAVFFLVTNLMVVQGLLLFYQQVVRWQQPIKKATSTLVQQATP